jgi:tetratricopeptide (TPR) repeat protein
MCGNLDEARDILRTGITLYPGGPFAAELARILLETAQALERRQIGSPEYRKSLLQAALFVLKEHDVAADDYLSYQLHAGLGETAAALPHLERASHARPELRIELARVYSLQGRYIDARKIAVETLALLQARLDARPTDRMARLWAAETAVLLNQFEVAVRVLENGWQDGRDPRFGVPLCHARVAWWDLVLALGDATESSLDLLRLALKADPDNVEVRRRLIAVGNGESALAGPARKLLLQMDERVATIANGPLSAL